MPAFTDPDTRGASATLALLLALGASLGVALAYDRHHARETPVDACIERGLSVYDNVGSDPSSDAAGPSDSSPTTATVASRCRKSAHAY